MLIITQHLLSVYTVYYITHVLHMQCTIIVATLQDGGF